jgi:hypothetical protein
MRQLYQLIELVIWNQWPVNNRRQAGKTRYAFRKCDMRRPRLVARCTLKRAMASGVATSSVVQLFEVRECISIYYRIEYCHRHLFYFQICNKYSSEPCHWDILEFTSWDNTASLFYNSFITDIVHNTGNPTNMRMSNSNENNMSAHAYAS